MNERSPVWRHAGPITRLFGALMALMLWAWAGPAAAAFTQGSFVNTTYEGCRLPAGATLPATLICADSDYTSGNLGKSWNELDLVPFRLTTSLGTQATATTTYDLYIAGDNKAGGYFGYDVITVPKVNAAKSDASCKVTAGPQLVISGITGGTDDTVYRQITMQQAKGSTCVIDWVQRLAIGASKYAGSNLQGYIFVQEDFKGSKSTIPIPVKEILPQEMSKTMSATQNAERTWNLTKTASPGSLDFGDVCKAPAGPLTKSVEVTVTWTKLAASPSGDVTVVTNINVKNPAARTITIDVTDSIYAGQTKSGPALASKTSGPIDVGANFNGLLTTFTYTIPSASAGSIGDWLNDEAVATYTDKITGVPVPGTVTATAKTQIALGTSLNETANIADLETISGTGLQFKVAAPSMGSFDGYTADTLATAVNWGVLGLTDSGSVTFAKTVVLDQPRITTGSLTDVATLVSTDSQFTTQATLFPVGISSSATVSLTVSKSIPLALKSGESIVVDFTVTPTAGGTGIPVSVTFTGPSGIGATALSTPLTGLAPASYTVTENGSTFYDAAHPGGMVLNLVPDQSQQTLDLSPKAGGVMDASNCSGTVSFVNRIGGNDYPKAKVAKITLPALSSSDPDYTWTFTLEGPSGFVSDSTTADAGQGFSVFASALTEEGTYTVKETLKPKWDLTGVVQPDGSSATTVCTFTVDFPADFGKEFACTFTNTKRGNVSVVKTVSGQPLTTEQFTFQLRQGASSNADGTALETLTTNSGGNGSTLNFATPLVPNTTYQMCEATQAGWMTSFNDPTSPLYVPGAFQPPGTTIPNPNVDNSWLCVDFQVAPGTTKVFNIDNKPPPGGRALTIGYWKNHASCTSSSTRKDPALDKQLYASSGILKGSKIDSLVFADHTTFGLYGQYPASTADCPYAVSLLDKRAFNGTKKASDPLFNMAAQLVATELNLSAGAYTCPAVVNTVTQAEGLLTKYSFTGFGYTGKLSAADVSLANSLATKLDNYNNNRTGVCP